MEQPDTDADADAGHTGPVRERAAFLHISKCAGTSVVDALVAATGRPSRPHQQFDTCYVAGLQHPERLQPAAHDAVAWDDRPSGVGPHVFFNHWSLPTLQQFFAPPDIATALREPMSRILSYVQYARSLPATTHRAWYPDTLPMDICRAPLVDVLRMEPAGRATDNLITRQVLWHDPRLPIGGFIESADAGALAADSIDALSQLGVVALVEDMPALWEAFGDWLGVPVQPAFRNRTPARQIPGLLRHTRDIGTTVELLHARTEADSSVWRHFAAGAGISDPTGLADELVERRLHEFCTTAFFADFSTGTPDEPVPPSTLGTALHDVVIGSGRVLALDLDARDLPPAPDRTLTFVTAAPGSCAHAQTVIELVDRDLVDLTDTLVGRDFDDILVGPHWITRLRPGATFEQLTHVADPSTRLLVVCPSQTAATRAAAHLRNSRWRDVSFGTLPEGTLVMARGGRAATTPPATTYGVPIDFTDPNDSRGLVLQLCADAPTVLELGCSEGLMTRAMTERGQRVTGVELDPVAADFAARFAARVVQADLDHAESLAALEGQSFHVVLAADVLEHLRDPEACLRRAVTLLAPGGTVIVSIPNLAHADVRLSLLDGRVPYADLGLLDRTHIHWFTYQGVKSLLAACGLVAVGWHRTERAPGTSDLPLSPDLVPLAQTWFHDDPEATTFQWVLECQRASEADAVPDPRPSARPRRFLHAIQPMGVAASGRALAVAVRRRIRHSFRR